MRIAERDPARLVVAGAGRMGRLHARNLASRVQSGVLAAVVDANAAAAECVASVHGVPAYRTLTDALERAEPDGVVVAAPPGAHAELVATAAAAGRPVLCEKPLGASTEDARAAVDAAAGVELRVGFQRRFDRGWLALRRAVRNGELGELKLLRSSHRNATAPPNADELGGALLDLGVHDFDSALWVGGPVRELYAQARGGAATVSLRFETGAFALVDLDGAAGYGFECSAEVVGTRATVRLDGTAEVAVLRDERRGLPIPADHAERHDQAYVSELDAFARLVRGEEVDAGATGAEALAAVRLAERAIESARSGRVVRVP